MNISRRGGDYRGLYFFNLIIVGYMKFEKKFANYDKIIVEAQKMGDTLY